MNLDFVITTPQFVQAQHHRLEEYKAFIKEIQRVGIDVAKRDKRFAKMKQFPPPKASLYSSIYKDLILPFKHVAFDEAQWGKHIESMTHLAVRDLYRTCTLLISGTFVANVWSDIFTFVDLIPGHPFKTMKDFQRGFSKDRARPPKTQFNNLNRFLLGFVVARPNSVLRLKDATILHAEFELSDTDEQEVTFWMMKWYQAIQAIAKQRRYAEDISESTNNDDDRTMRLVQAAQMVACHPRMSEAASSQVQPLQVSQLLDTFKQLLESHMATEDRNYDATIGASDGVTEGAQFKQHTIDTAEFLYAQRKTNIMLEVFKKHKLPDNETSSSGDPPAQATPKQKRVSWLKKLRQMDDDDLYSARLQKIVDLILDCRYKHSGQKIVVFSHYLRFLDLLGEALHRQDKSHKIRVYQFNGQMSIVDREVAKVQFSEASSDDLNVILVTAGCGGAGVNLASASVVIQSEVWWNRNEEMQAWFRVRRPGQEHEVTIYIVVATNSAVDYHIIATRDRKSAVLRDMMAVLRREDEKDPEIPEVVPY
jgi:SNF2 family DNA or RNA helicase